jgi:hypothetical protein
MRFHAVSLLDHEDRRTRVQRPRTGEENGGKRVYFPSVEAVASPSGIFTVGRKGSDPDLPLEVPDLYPGGASGTEARLVLLKENHFELPAEL